jgi:hypothetical protein
VDSVHGAVDRADPVHRGSAAIAVSPSSSELDLHLLRRSRLPDEGGGGRGKHMDPGFKLTGARKAAERRCDDGGGALSVGSLGARREGKQGWGRSGERSGCRGALL